MQLIYRILYLCNTNSIYSPLLFAVHTIQYTFYTKLHVKIIRFDALTFGRRLVGFKLILKYSEFIIICLEMNARSGFLVLQC